MINRKYIFEDENCKFVIIKISDKEALENMKSGEWWLRHPAYYQIGDDSNRDIFDSEDSKISRIIKQNGTVANTTVKLFRDDEDSARVVCFYKLKIDKNGFFVEIDNRMKRFGDYFIFVDKDKLLQCFKDEKEVDGYSFRCSEMNYLSEDYSGVVSRFDKRNDYCFQKEWRIRSDSVISKDEIETNLIILDLKAKLMKEQQDETKYANLYRAANDSSIKAQYMKKAIQASREYDRLYNECLKLKSEYILKLFKAKQCTSEIYELAKLLEETSSIGDF